MTWLVAAIALSLSGGSASATGGVPRVLRSNCSGEFAARPAFIVFTCDGSGVTGGGDAKAKTAWGHFGHIRWLTWTSREAVGLAQDWSKDFRWSAGRLSVFYVREGGVYRLQLSHPVNGRCTMASASGTLFVSHLVPVTDVGITYYIWR
jgi:hypothetical protein